jgi:hypothetical protein
VRETIWEGVPAADDEPPESVTVIEYAAVTLEGTVEEVAVDFAPPVLTLIARTTGGVF